MEAVALDNESQNVFFSVLRTAERSCFSSRFKLLGHRGPGPFSERDRILFWLRSTKVWYTFTLGGDDTYGLQRVLVREDLP